MPSTVIISQPAGGGDGYNIHINNFYNGVMFLRSGEWSAYFAENSILNLEALSVLVEIITTHPNYIEE